MEPVIIGNATLYNADCIEIMKTMPDNSLDSIICDPPYLISFMNKGFDSQHKAMPGANEGQKMQEWHRRWVTEAYRILKPGGHLAAFGGDRTHHRLMSAMEDVGFELRQNCYWVFGSGFPKSMDASKAVESHLMFGSSGKHDQRIAAMGDCYIPSESAGTCLNGTERAMGGGRTNHPPKLSVYANEISKQWTGYGTATKPAVEICCVGRKPMIGTLAENLLEWGTGAMNLDACRVVTRTENESGWSKSGSKASENRSMSGTNYERPPKDEIGIGRFPPHLLLDGSDVVKKCFPETTSGAIDPSRHIHKHGKGNALSGSKDGSLNNYLPHQKHEASSGSASRFFPSLPYDEEDCATICYCAKASKQDRDEGCDGLDAVYQPTLSGGNGIGNRGPHDIEKRRNHHPTTKPTALMKWICRLLTPKGGTLLDPFMGSGSTLKAAVLENFTCIGIEMDPDYFKIAKARVAHVSPETVFAPVAVKRAETKPANFDLFGEVA